MHTFTTLSLATFAAGVAAERRDTEVTTLLWQLTSDSKKIDDLRKLLVENPEYVKLRSADGRGAMWWAHEAENMDAVAFMKAVNKKDADTMLYEEDDNGKRPQHLCKDKSCKPSDDQMEKAKKAFKEAEDKIAQEYKDLEAEWEADDEF